MENLQVWAALIEATGVFAGSIVIPILLYCLGRRIYPKKIETFSEKRHDVSKIMDCAIKSIYIIVQLGDEFLEKHQLDLEKYLKNNPDLVIRYLIIRKRAFKILQNYTGENTDLSVRKKTIKRLRKLCRDYRGRFLLSKFDGVITTSYIAVDIDNVGADGKWGYTSRIQCMPYQYHLKNENSFIITLNSKIGTKKYEKLVKSITEMWNAAKPYKVK